MNKTSKEIARILSVFQKQTEVPVEDSTVKITYTDENVSRAHEQLLALIEDNYIKRSDVRKMLAGTKGDV